MSLIISYILHVESDLLHIFTWDNSWIISARWIIHLPLRWNLISPLFSLSLLHSLATPKHHLSLSHTHTWPPAVSQHAAGAVAQGQISGDRLPESSVCNEGSSLAPAPSTTVWTRAEERSVLQWWQLTETNTPQDTDDKRHVYQQSWVSTWP